VVELLLWTYPEGVYVKDGAGLTPRIVASEYGSDEVIRLVGMAGGFCEVSKAARARVEEEYDESLRGVLAAHESRVASLRRSHASELHLRTRLEERLRANLKCMKVHYSHAEREIRTTLNQKRRLRYVQRGGMCPPADLRRKEDTVDSCEDRMMDDMERLASMLNDADDSPRDSRFVADVLESKLTARGEELRETEGKLRESRDGAKDLLERLDGALNENDRQREEIRNLNLTVERLAGCVDRLAVPEETLRRAADTRDEALEEVKRSRARFHLEEPVLDGGNTNCDSEELEEEGFVWQMGPEAAAAAKTTRLGRGEYEPYWRRTKASGGGKRGPPPSTADDSEEEDEEIVGIPSSVRMRRKCGGGKMIDEKDTVVTAVTLTTSTIGPEEEEEDEDDDGMSLGDRTHEEMPAQVVELVNAERAETVPVAGGDDADRGRRDAAEIGDKARQQQQQQPQSKGPREDKVDQEQRDETEKNPAADDTNDVDDDDNDDDETKVLAVAENIEKSLIALQTLLANNPEALAALRGKGGAAAAAAGGISVKKYNRKKNSGGGGNNNNPSPLLALSESILVTDGEREIELLVQRADDDDDDDADGGASLADNEEEEEEYDYDVHSPRRQDRESRRSTSKRGGRYNCRHRRHNNRASGGGGGRRRRGTGAGAGAGADMAYGGSLRDRAVGRVAGRYVFTCHGGGGRGGRGGGCGEGGDDDDESTLDLSLAHSRESISLLMTRMWSEDMMDLEEEEEEEGHSVHTGKTEPTANYCGIFSH